MSTHPSDEDCSFTEGFSWEVPLFEGDVFDGEHKIEIDGKFRRAWVTKTGLAFIDDSGATVHVASKQPPLSMEDQRKAINFVLYGNLNRL